MPQHKSCEKRMRTSARSRSRNRAYRAMLKKAIRQVREASSHQDAQTALAAATSLLDRVAGKGIIHKNRAADKKARLTAFVKSIQA